MILFKSTLVFLNLLFFSTFLFAEKSIDNDSIYESAMNYYCFGLVNIIESPLESIFSFKKALPLFKYNDDWREYIDCYNGISNGFYIQNRFDSAIKYSNLAFTESGYFVPLKDKVYGVALNNLAAIYYHKGSYLKTINLSRQGIKIWENSNSPQNLSLYYYNLAIVYKKLGDYNESLRLFEKVIELRLKNNAVNLNEVAEGYIAIAKIYLRQKKYSQALHYNSIADSLYQLDKDLPSMVDLYHNTAIIYLEQNKPDSSLIYLNKAKDIAYINKKTISVYQSLSRTKAKVYQKIGKKKRAIQEAVNFLNTTTQKHQKFASPNSMGLANFELAKIYFHFKEYKKAQEVLITAFEFYNDTTILNIDEISLGKVSRPFDTAKLLQIFSELTYGLYVQNGELSYLHQSLNLSNLATQLIPQIYRQFQNEDSRLFMAEQSIPTYEQAIEVALELHQITKEDSFLNYAFKFSEQNKAALLYESLKESEYKQTIGIPDSILERESDAKIELTFYRGKVFKEEQKKEKGDPEKLARWRNKVFELEQLEREIDQQLESSYPQYYQLKYQTATISPDSIQKLLRPDQGMVEYFRGDSTTYAFVVTNKDFWVTKLPNHDSIPQWVNEMRKGICHYWMDPERTSEMFLEINQLYVDNAFRLYNTLFKSLEKDGTSLPKELILIPDGVMGYIPFDALLTEVPKSPKRFGSHSYVLKKHQISYGYSATLWNNMLADNQNEIPASENMLAVGPVFGKEKQLFASVEDLRRDGFNPLSFNRKEVRNINNLFDGELLLDNRATKSNFLQHAPEFRFIHLSTHAKANDNDSRFSRIAFTPINDTTEENDFLNLSEICNLHLKADMIVLSACETALGELKKGEGIMSLARAFTYAGAKSIITTLWSVDDNATSDLMTRFYSHLAAGLRKDDALRQARLDYITDTDHRFSHPFFWAAAVPMGNMEALDVDMINSNWHWLTGIILGLLLVGSYFLFRRK